jgi:hypothetical protein
VDPHLLSAEWSADPPWEQDGAAGIHATTVVTRELAMQVGGFAEGTIRSVSKRDESVFVLVTDLRVDEEDRLWVAMWLICGEEAELTHARAKGVSAVALFATFGCSSELGHVPSAVVTDSAGVRMVTYVLADADVPDYRIVGEPDLVIGEMDGTPEYALSRVDDLALANNGSILVSDGMSQEVRVFDSGGRHVRTLGGAGDGPGEFATAPSIAGLAGDTAFLFDVRSNRVTSFVLDGAMIDVVTLAAERVGRPESLVRLEDGTYLSASRWVPPNDEIEFYDPRLELDSIVVARLDAAGRLLDTVRVMADRVRARAVQDRGGGVVGVLQTNAPYSARASVLAVGLRPLTGRSDAFSLRFHRRTGGVESILTVRGVEHPATAEEIRARQEAVIREQFGDREIDPTVWRVNIEFLPDRLPAFGNVVVSRVGDVWVSLTEYDLSEGLDWLVFSPSGELRGKVHTPAELRVRAIDEDLLLGFVLDELDVPRVRRYPLRSP